MNIKYKFLPFITLSLALIAHQNTMAAKVYTWTDEEGIVHFSDVPPGDTKMSDASEINIDIFGSENIDPDKYSVINQVDRMAERRRQTTEERLAKKKLYLEEKRLALELEQTRQNEVIASQEYQPTYYYANPRPYYINQPRFGQNHLSRPHRSKHTQHSKIAHHRKFSKGHLGINKYNSRIDVRF